MQIMFLHITLLANLAATLFMCGLIWFVQVVHYPLFSEVGESGYSRYQIRHMRLTTFVVGPPMLIELVSGAALLLVRDPHISIAILRIGFALIVMIWVSTICLQVPRHDSLRAGFIARDHRVLVISNWIRTAGWSVRAGLMVWIVFELIEKAAQ